jgi:hypothetical protein
MNIAVCSIATGTYFDLFCKLKSSMNGLFLINHNVSLFLFTDNDKQISGINRYFINNLPWPLTTLLRFHYINQISDSLKTYDFIYYIDSDCEIVDIIDENIFPNDSGLVGVEHPWQNNSQDFFENNKDSKSFYINNKTCYYQGCLFGGTPKEFLKMVFELDVNIKIDLKNNIISKWHDESHLNKYFCKVPPKRLDSGYAYPNPIVWGNGFPFKKRIIHLNFNSKK